MALRVAGYTKLAKLWDKNREEALSLQLDYYNTIFADDPDFELVDVYVDITGNKDIFKRPEMLRLLKDCLSGEIDVIYAQTKGYLVANTRDFCYLIKFLFDMPHRIDIVTEDTDYNINTGYDAEDQRKELYTMATKYTDLNPSDYKEWVSKVTAAIEKL